MIRCKRVYEAAADEDGQRVLVDRLWPRNKRKEDLQGQWLREVAPSDELRRAFHQGEVDFAGFTQRYQQQLAAHPEHWYPLLDLAAKGPLTLLYAAKNTEHNNAQVLAEWLEDELERGGPGSSPVCYAT
ncbi:MarR family transcriptional regulator [Pseudomonas putida]|nr:MarR family transcriptional regulator [Pseudomonas putida]